MPKKKDQKPDEEIREIIMRFLYDLHQKSGSRTGSRLKISEIKRELKKEGISAKEIIRNLDYLIHQKRGFLKSLLEAYAIALYIQMS